MTKKIISWIVIILSLGAMILGIVWLSFNWENLTAGTGIYTEDDLNEKYNEGLQDGLERGEEWRVLVSQYKEKLSEYENEVNSLTVALEQEKNNNNSNQDTIAALEEKLSIASSEKLSLQNEITRLEGLIESYEELAQGTYEVNFYINDTLFLTKAVKKDSIITDTIMPSESNEYRFDGWSVDKSSIIDINSYQITENTNFYAILTPKYKVEFVNGDDIYMTQYIVQNECATLISNPTKDYFQFEGWLLNDEIVNPFEIKVVTDLTFVASYTEMYEWFEVPRNNESVNFTNVNDGEIDTEEFVNFNATDYAKIRVTFSGLRLYSNDGLLNRVVLDENYKFVEYSSSVIRGEFVLEEGQVFECDCEEFTGDFGTTKATKIKISFEWDREDKEFLLKFECENSVYKLDTLTGLVIEVYQPK